MIEMPLYEYHCSQCKKTAEYLLKFSSPPPEKCELCGATGFLQKQISQSAFQLKGTGWYVTDFKNPQKSNAAKSDGSEQGKESGGEAAASAEPKIAAAPSEPAASPSKAAAE
jgi:putative FmdB family regulatory protein